MHNIMASRVLLPEEAMQAEANLEYIQSGLVWLKLFTPHPPHIRKELAIGLYRRGQITKEVLDQLFHMMGLKSA